MVNTPTTTPPLATNTGGIRQARTSDDIAQLEVTVDKK